MCWELKRFSEPWRQFLQSRVVANGQVIRDIFAVLLPVLHLLSIFEYICSFFAIKDFGLIGCQSNTFGPARPFLDAVHSCVFLMTVENQEIFFQEKGKETEVE